MAISCGKRELLVIFALALILALLLVLVQMHGSNVSNAIRHMTSMAVPSSCEDCVHKTQTLKQSRNEVSRELNAVKQKLGQMSCKLIAQEKKPGVSENGGWCLTESKPNSPHHRFDKPFCTALSEFLKGKSVASFGDGPGAYKKKMEELDQVRKYDAFDGAPFAEQATDNRVKFLDLTGPQYGMDQYDWVVSLEVAEHIPAKYEAVYVDNMIRHAKEGLVLSWSRPGQGGLSHVNNKAAEDVIRLMRSKGFDVDQVAGKALREKATLPWLKQNVNIYRRRDDSPLDLDEL